MDSLLVERAAGVVTITLHRPERLNAIPSGMWSELTALFLEVAANEADRAMVLTGAGDAFCSGADMASFTETGTPALSVVRRVGECALALIRMPKPTIARVRGIAAGAGANMALACDLVVAADDARFSQIFVKRGISLDFAGSWLLPRLVGLHKAKELALLGGTITAAEAATLGLVNKVVPVGELDGAVAAWADQLAAGPPAALSLTKALLNDSFTSSVDRALEAEAVAQGYNFGTRDLREALTAYREKRPPRYTGR